MKAKKSLGQNFLKSEPALRKIIEAGEIKSDDVILEIGPGKGALTKKLLGSSGKVLAVEKDKELIELLKEKFKKEIKERKLTLIEGDILEFDPLLISPLIRGVGGLHYKIIANIPYNITGAILKKFLTEKNQPERMVLMVQNEVAKRIVARDDKESILSISVKAYGEPSMIMKVPARYFSPAPKVDSAIILIKNISRKNFRPLPSLPLAKGEVPKAEGVNEQKFWEIVKAGFAHKRKKLSGNLKSIKGGGNASALDKLGLGNKRAEDLTLQDWLLLAK
jgi:16S rRNA (adenine1518-N6/adenine1519-N6)-dimethyltransferase